MGVRERKERERERRRQQIIVAAKRVFSEKGFTRARMEDIANEAELAPATLYIYFKNKEELFASFSLTLLQCLSAKLKTIVNDPGMGSEDRLASLRVALYEIYAFDPWGMGSMLQVQSGEIFSNLSDEFLQTFRGLFKRSNLLLKTLFQEGIDTGVFVNKHPMAMVNILWSTLAGVLLMERNRKVLQSEDGGFRDAFNFAFDIIERGLRRTYLQKEVRDKVCCQCALKQDCSGLRELFKTPYPNCAELVAISSANAAIGLIKPADTSTTAHAGCYV
ncbi:MAG: TetR/AcrR family transcriptional regulator [Desulfobacterales bacterium]|jgi:AcrR family transcriptional regulator|nr:TetR/AcrR family transcriptional regulator [Desulfobacterales bacterium]